VCLGLEGEPLLFLQFNSGVAGCLLSAQLLFAQSDLLTQIRYREGSEQRVVVGKLLREFSDGSSLLLAPDGGLLTLHGDQISESKPVQESFEPASDEAIIASLQEIVGDGFRYYRTKNYLIAYDTSAAYAEWVGQLFERLKRGFYNYWNQRRVPLEQPSFPLIAVVFSNKPGYLAYSQREIGDSAQSMFGYYNMNSNRVVMYDLTGVDGLVPRDQRVHTQAVINQILSQPQAERTVATIVHEAVHQLAFNSGLQVRLADNPLWLSEGLAMFFEAPDLQSPQAWNIGNVNYHNLRLFHTFLSRRPEDSLLSLVRDDQRFRDATTVSDAYPESWALTYFLMKTRNRQFAAYLKELGQLTPLDEGSPEQRVATFEKHFGDIQKLNKAFLAYVAKLR
jgi:hypothetical protein